MTKILSIIPARGGSKGLPRKNILNVGGKPLISWTIEASLSSKYISKTVVSSDDNEILDIALSYGADVILRPKELSGDYSPTEPVLIHVINELLKSGDVFDYLVLLQPTSPLRTAQIIDDAISIFLDKKPISLISVRKVNNKILKAFIPNKKGFIQGISNNDYPFMRRQDLPDTYMSNGAIYIVKLSAFLKNRSLFSDSTIPFIMTEKSSIDIDTLDDIKRAELFL